MQLSFKKIAIIIGVFIAIILILSVGSSLTERNDMGWYHIKQAFYTGTMSVINKPGTFWQWFARIEPYQISDMVYFSKHPEDGGKGPEAAPIKVRFNGGSIADISGSIKFRLSTKENDQLSLHEEFKSYKSVKLDLVRQIATEALMNTATLMKAEESYSTRRSEFTAVAEAQVKHGIYETKAKEEKMEDAEGNDFIERSVEVVMKDGLPVIRKTSPFSRYNIEILQFVIKDMDFDKTIDALIAKKKEAEQKKVVAKAKAEEAKQQAITEKEQGAARIAKAKADEEVEKIKEVTQASKKFEVAKFAALEAKEKAKKIKAEGEAKAAANRALVSAGLTPIEKATINKETRIGVAEALAKVKLPKLMVIGGGGKNSAINPFDAVGLEAFNKIVKDVSK